MDKPMASKQQNCIEYALASGVQTVRGLEKIAWSAACAGRTEDIAQVLNYGLSVKAKFGTVDGRTLLHYAATGGHKRTVMWLLLQGAEMSTVAGQYGTALHQAAHRCHLSTVKALLKAGSPVHLLSSDGGSVLHFATEGGCVKVIKELVSDGCCVNAADQTGETPLHCAAKQGKTLAALELIRHGAQKAIVAGKIGTPLHQAAFKSHNSTVKALLKAGCPVDGLASDGSSIMHFAVSSNNVEVIREILSTGCDINVTDDKGGTPLHVAAEEGNTEGALMLIRHGAEKTKVAGVFGTPLHLAARNGHVSTVKALLKTGCPVDVVDGNGSSVLDAAKQGGNTKVITEVLNAGADNSTADDNGESPRQEEAETGGPEDQFEADEQGFTKEDCQDLYQKAIIRLLQLPDVQDFLLLDAKLLQFLDCGGQLAYHDILPLFTTIPSIYLHVFNLTEKLDQCLTDRIQIVGEEKELYSKAMSPVTTAQMITRSLMTIKSLTGKKGNLPADVLQNEPSDPCVMLVGTHLDVMETKNEKPQMETKIEEVNTTLRQALKSEAHRLEEMVLKNSTPPLPSMFFPVNNKLYTGKNEGQRSAIGVHAVERLRKRIKDQISCVRAKVPVKWYLFQLLEASHSREGCKPVYRYSELYQTCQKELAVADVGEFHTMVTYFNALGIFVHLCGEDIRHTEVSTCFIFTSPTYLSEAVSKLYQVQFLSEDRCEGGLLNLKRRGLLTKKSLHDLNVDEAHLKHSDFMNILVQLFIGAEISADDEDKGTQLFIPSVLMLPAEDHSCALPSELQDRPHIVLTFKDLLFIPCGVFTGAVTRLLREWKISKSKKVEPISRIHIPFAVGGRDNICLFDCATHIRVVMAVSDERNAQKYRDTILDAIAESYCFLFHCKTTMDQQNAPCKECLYNPFLILGLLCQACESECNHIAVLHLDDGNPQIVRCQETDETEELSDEQRILFLNMEHYAVDPQQCTVSHVPVGRVGHKVMSQASFPETIPGAPLQPTILHSSSLHASLGQRESDAAADISDTVISQKINSVSIPAPGEQASATLIRPADIAKAIGYQVDAKWRHFGTHLHVQSTLMDSMYKDNLAITSGCMLDLVSKWLTHHEGTGDLLRTWQTVVEAVRDTGFGQLAIELAEKHGVTLTQQ